MAGKTGIKIVKNTLNAGLAKFKVSRDKIHPRAMGAMGLQLLNNIVNGSPKEPVVPPILEGVLRSSGSVFLGSRMIGLSSGMSKGWKVSDEATPNTDFSAPENTITVGFNTSYAARMHETDWNPGPISRQSGDVGNKFIKKHLDADREELFNLYGDILKKDIFNE